MKHAFLIMAHSNYALLGRLFKKLDHPDNTLYLHIDAKSKFSKDDEDTLRQILTHSHLHLIPRTSVTWGGYSQIYCHLRLVEAAVTGHHDYYHFISGVDFPTKPMNVIHGFFEKHRGNEFVHFCDEDFVQSNRSRYSLYHFWQDRLGRDFSSPLYFARRLLLAVQSRIFKVDRTKKFPDTVYKMGSNWSSFTHAFAEYLLEKEGEIRTMFSRGFCNDEAYLQTVIYNSPFRDRLYQADEGENNLRSIDWTREGLAEGSPHTYVVEDYESLLASPNLFCRKVGTDTPEQEALIQKLELL